MIIGLDIDGVCLDFVQAMRNVGSLPDAPSPSSFYFHEEWGITEDQFSEILHMALDHSAEVHEHKYTLLTDADYAAMAGHEIHIVTARHMNTIPQWLVDNVTKACGYDVGVFSHVKNKPAVCERIGADLMIDDAVHILEGFHPSHRTRPVARAQSWNTNYHIRYESVGHAIAGGAQLSLFR